MEAGKGGEVEGAGIEKGSVTGRMAEGWQGIAGDHDGNGATSQCPTCTGV